MEPSMLLPVAVIVAVVVGGGLIGAYRPADEHLVAAWAGARGLTLMPQSRGMASWYLRTARIPRTWGAVGGMLVPSFVALAWSGRIELAGAGSRRGLSPGDIGWVSVGSLVGALHAEVSLVRPRLAGRRAASLVPRDLADYLPRGLLWAQRDVAAVAGAGALATGVLPYRASPPQPGVVTVVGFAAYVGAFAFGLERVQRWVVTRRQPFTDPSVVAADDAIRSQSVHSIAGAGLASLLLMAAGSCFLVWASDVAVLRWTMWLPALGATLLGLVACQRYGNRAWSVRRRPATPPAAATA